MRHWWARRGRVESPSTEPLDGTPRPDDADDPAPQPAQDRRGPPPAERPARPRPLPEERLLREQRPRRSRHTDRSRPSD